VFPSPQIEVGRYFELDMDGQLSTLLSDIRDVFASDVERIPTSVLLDRLRRLPHGRWLRLDGIKLAKLLSVVDVKPRQLWIRGRNRRGYQREDFLLAWINC
jgi:hypothetical protein